MNTECTYNITVSSKVPVTVWYNGTGVVPSRTIAYRTVKIKTTTETAQYGVIRYCSRSVPVKSTRIDACHPWGQWEVVKMIDPFAYAYLKTNKETAPTVS